MIRSFSILGTAAVLIALATALPLRAALVEGRVSGTVRDSHGNPQIGALVEIVKPDLSIAARTFTDDHGRYNFAQLLPGIYSIKATGALFLPTLRENLRLTASSRLIVNLTLSTLYEAFRWLPARPRPADEPQDDWTWTLRLSANRPLLRMLENGPLVVVTDADGQNPALKARITVRGGESAFGDGGIHHDFEVERAEDDSRQLILRADLSQAQGSSLDTMVGYEQQLAPGRTIRSVAAFVDQPSIAGGAQATGLQTLYLRTAETLDLTSALSLDFGSEVQAIHLGSTVVASHPFARVSLRPADSTTIEYRMATSPQVQSANGIDSPENFSPAATMLNGRLALEHGLHQELAVAHTMGRLHMRVSAYHDQVKNAIVDGGGTLSQAGWNSGNILYDSATGLLQASGGNYGSNGISTEVRADLDAQSWITFNYALGSALALPAVAGNQSIGQVLSQMEARQAQLISAALGGRIGPKGAQWRASYRWQSDGTLTPVDLFNSTIPDPYLSLYFRQPIHCRRVLPDGMEAMVDVRNLLAQGYRPFVTSDGSTLYFAQAARALEGGLSFSF